VESWDVLNVL
jgi:hypothetical protein